ncbi:MAG: outer membrane beta-barrel protein [Chitinophagaceae bacterium]|nr:outer membrane beta-barrel protein [Chitinophagaceae bacterium]
MRKIYLSFGFVLLSILVLAQKNGSVKGVVFDTMARQPVAAATITLLEKKDSSLISFTMTDNEGRFELTGIPNGEYRLMITHVNYHNSNMPVTITDENKKHDLANIIMNDKNQVLSEVIVTNEAPPVTMVGDTIQYNAGSFKVQPNASVEQLLKKLPGVKVEKDGTVKAQGEKVSRVLVDGKEFFGNDPKIATKNLPADAVDKVQVYDKQSDQAQLTGFEDGNYEKTINLKLKKDKKKGVFGKVSAGGGDKKRYEGRFNVNSFKGARQVSAIGMGNNTNAEGFSFMDILNFTGELARMQRGSGGGNISLNVSADDAAAMGLGGRSGGINTAWGGGINYNNIIGNKLDMQSNYFYNRYNPDIERHINRQNFLPGTTNYYNQNSWSDNLNNSHRFNLNTLYQMDSMHSLRINPSLSYQKTKNQSLSDFQTRSASGAMINEGNSDNLSETEGFNFRNDLVFRKKFNRRGRTLSLSLQTSINESDGNGKLNSITDFYDQPSGNISRRDTVRQKSNSTGSLFSYNARVVYTEPIFKRSLLEFSAGKSNSINKAELITYDYNNQSGKYDELNDVQTNDFENTYGFINGGVRLRTQKKKYNYAIGLNWQQAELKGKIISGNKDSVISKTFRNLLPNARFQYSFSRFKSFTLSYTGNTNQPNMSQLQPVPDLSNPLYIREGNADLKQEYNHLFQANLNLISPYKNKNLFGYMTLVATRNKIVNYDSVIAQTGVRYTKPVNVNGVYNINSSLSYSMPVRFLKATLEVSARTRYGRTKQFINSLANDIKTLTFGPELRLDMNATDKVNIGLGAALDHNKTKYSLQSAMNNKYLLQEYNTSFDWQLPKQFFLSTDFTYTINSQRSAGFNARIPIWNAGISRQFLRYNRGELKFSAYDLLNRNTGISRNTSQNYIEDSRVNTLRRFFMLSFTYSLSKTGLNNAGSGGMRIITR